jgi:hypothetical protein
MIDTITAKTVLILGRFTPKRNVCSMLAGGTEEAQLLAGLV